MTNLIDHVAYLSDEIGPRPSGTEEEQQAAIYIMDRLQKDAHLPVEVEDFASSTDSSLPSLICYGAMLVAGVLAVLVQVAIIPAAILALVAFSLFALEFFDHPVLSRFFKNGVSQNVVATYRPPRRAHAAGSRRRKVILVAHYDSGKVHPEYRSGFVKILKYLQIASHVAMALAALLIILRALFFRDADGAGIGVFNALLIVALVAILLPVVRLGYGHIAAYNDGANDNASGVAVLLEVARRIGNGMVSSTPRPMDGIVHDEEDLRAEGLVGPNTALVYEDASPEEELAAAKAAIAALTGKPVAGAAESYDIARNLVHVTDVASIPTPSERESDESLQDVRAEDAADTAVPTEASSGAAAAESDADAEFESTHKAVGGMPEPSESLGQPVSSALSASPHQEPTEVPEWYAKATARARKEAEESTGKVERSRYAEIPVVPAAESPAVASDAIHAEEPCTTPVSDSTEDAPETPGQAPSDAVSSRAEKMDIAPAGTDEMDSRADSEGAGEQEIHAEETAIDERSADVREEDTAVSEAADRDETVSPDETDKPDEPVEEGQVSSSDGSEDGSEAAEEEPLPVDPLARTQKLPASVSAERSAELADRAKKERVSVTYDDPLRPAADLGATSVMNPVAAAASAQDNAMHVFEIPRISPAPTAAEPLSSFDDLRQRAPLASATESASKATAKDLLSTLPPIEGPESSADATAKIEINRAGTFAAASATGAFEPLGDELVGGLTPEDLYVDDADDSALDEDYSETGAIVGEGYVDMPKSRIGRFFDRFRKPKEPEESTSDWLGVDEDFNARDAGKARGGWDSFKDDDDWKGGAFSDLRARIAGRMAHDDQVFYSDEELAGAEAPDAPSDTDAVALDGAPDGATQAMLPLTDADTHESLSETAVAQAASPAERDAAAHADEIDQVYSFAAGDINTEIWFVALGSQVDSNEGIRAFLSRHAAEMRGAVIVNLEALGAGEVSYVEKEGAVLQSTSSSRMKRYLRRAGQSLGVSIKGASIEWKDSASSYALRHHMQGIGIVGMEGDKPAGCGEAGDTVEAVDPALLSQNTDVVIELLKNI